MMIQKLNKFKSRLGDDEPFYTIHYRDVPQGFRLADLEQSPTATRLNEWFNHLVKVADLHYMDYEINGTTYQDFFNNLQDAYNRNYETLERVLKVYNDDIANAILGRTEKTTYDLKTTNDNKNTDKGKIVNIDIPDDNVFNETPKDRTENESENNNTGEQKQTGTVTVEMSDIGVRPNYESLNGFIDNNRPIEQLFIDVFKDCFSYYESMNW